MSKVFIILGMHRSATSFVSEGLKKMGVNIGKELLPAGKGNEKGHFENKDFIKLNDKILKKAGGSWDNPPKEKEIIKVGKKLKDEIKATVNRNKSELWGWKDPRTTLTIKCYLSFIEHPFFITCWRDPMEVAKSLNCRDNMPIEKGLKLADEYNKRLLKFLTNIIKLRSK